MVSKKTIHNRLLEQGLKVYSPGEKQLLTDKMKQARYQFDDKVQTVRQRSGEEYFPDCLTKTAKFSCKSMVS